MTKYARFRFEITLMTREPHEGRNVTEELRASPYERACAFIPSSSAITHFQPEVSLQHKRPLMKNFAGVNPFWFFFLFWSLNLLLTLHWSRVHPMHLLRTWCKYWYLYVHDNVGKVAWFFFLLKKRVQVDHFVHSHFLKLKVTLKFMPPFSYWLLRIEQPFINWRN